MAPKPYPLREALKEVKTLFAVFDHKHEKMIHELQTSRDPQVSDKQIDAGIKHLTNLENDVTNVKANYTFTKDTFEDQVLNQFIKEKMDFLKSNLAVLLIASIKIN
ncbi:MAG: hypothetical protein K0U41_06460 [Gammaproteobacteria bacterium]|nr:hypothetical protein [Gammaproteobacteria bacterium]